MSGSVRPSPFVSRLTRQMPVASLVLTPLLTLRWSEMRGPRVSPGAASPSCCRPLGPVPGLLSTWILVAFGDRFFEYTLATSVICTLQ